MILTPKFVLLTEIHFKITENTIVNCEFKAQGRQNIFDIQHRQCTLNKGKACLMSMYSKEQF